MPWGFKSKLPAPTESPPELPPARCGAPSPPPRGEQPRAEVYADISGTSRAQLSLPAPPWPPPSRPPAQQTRANARGGNRRRMCGHWPGTLSGAKQGSVGGLLCGLEHVTRLC